MNAETPATTCYVHTKTAASDQCSRCGRDICLDCEEYEAGGVHCGPCANTVRSRRMLRNLAIACTALVLMVALVLLVTRGGDDDDKKSDTTAPAASTKANKTKDGVDYGRYAGQIAAYRKILEGEPCNKRVAVRLGEKLNTAGDYKGTLAMTKKWFAKCGELFRLLWVASYAHEQLGQFDKAAAIDTTLIEHDPRDNDFWWWRGKNYLRLKRNREAAGDFRQSIANQNLSRSSGIAVLKLARVSKDLGEPCVGAYALQYYSDAHDGDVNRRAKDLLAELHLAGNCAKVGGKGKARIVLDSKKPITRVKVRINGKPATFMVDIRSGYTVVATSVAQKLGLEASDEPALYVYTGGKLRSGARTRLATLKLEGASAKDVHALVADLPEGIDGVLGLSFFWRFEVLDSGDAYLLKAR
jgi:predicted aspartyl protease